MALLGKVYLYWDMKSELELTRCDTRGESIPDNENSTYRSSQAGGHLTDWRNRKMVSE